MINSPEPLFRPFLACEYHFGSTWPIRCPAGKTESLKKCKLIQISFFQTKTKNQFLLKLAKAFYFLTIW